MQTGLRRRCLVADSCTEMLQERRAGPPAPRTTTTGPPHTDTPSRRMPCARITPSAGYKSCQERCVHSVGACCTPLTVKRTTEREGHVGGSGRSLRSGRVALPRAASARTSSQDRQGFCGRLGHSARQGPALAPLHPCSHPPPPPPQRPERQAGPASPDGATPAGSDSTGAPARTGHGPAAKDQARRLGLPGAPGAQQLGAERWAGTCPGPNLP